MYELLIHYRVDKDVKMTHVSNDDLSVKHVIHEVSFGANHELTIIPHTKITLLKVVLEKSIELHKDSKVLFNGYQSWTQTKWLSLKDRMRGLDHLPEKLIQKYALRPYGDYHFTTYHKDLWHGFTFAKFKDGADMRLIGSKNASKAFLIIYVNKKKKRLFLESDVSNLEINAPFKAYDFIDYVGDEKTIEKAYVDQLPEVGKKPKIKGYTSWYRHYQDINHDLLLNDLKGIDHKDYDLFQIDDGYQAHIGDWMIIDHEKFAKGLSPLVKAIKKKGLTPGLWMAPFVCETDSDLFINHKDYLAYDDDLNPIEAGSNWSGFYALDWQKDAVKEYIKSCLLHYVHMGFTFFKLDFLYAAALSHKPNQTRAQAMHEAMVFLRSVLKDQVILGCGVPLSSSFGLVDYMRIGPDVSLSFDDKWFMKWIHRERISTKETILNTINRHFLDGHVFYNDPDVYLLRNEGNTLSFKQKEALVSINCLFGSLILTSDDVANYTDSEKEVYQKALKLLDAKDVRVSQDKHIIQILYQLDGHERKLTYHIKKGIFIT
ncbi:MAG: glycoside hydrolase family 36 protein [Acholeplasmataceae bacterium]